MRRLRRLRRLGRLGRLGRLLLPFVVVPFATASHGVHAQASDAARSRLADDLATEEPVDEAEGSDSDDASAPAAVRAGEDLVDDGAGFGGGADPEREAMPAAAPPPAPESYTVQTGDTLWNLSQRFLNNPWYWPKIWSYNQSVDNPNWIRPGTVLRFYPGSAPVAPGAVTVVAEAEDEDSQIDDPGEGGGFEGDIKLPTVDGVGVRRREFFISDAELRDAGRIVNSPEEKRWLSVEDRAYVTLTKAAEPGDLVQVFRPQREVRHPVSGARVGQVVVMTGQIRIDQPGREQALGTVVDGWDTVERGDLVGTLPVFAEPMQRTENRKNVKGYVVDAAPEARTMLAESYTVIIDKGTTDGVVLGNTFAVLRTGDPYTRQYSGMLDEVVGEALVIEAGKHTSTAILTVARRLIVPGDRVEMRTR